MIFTNGRINAMILAISDDAGLSPRIRDREEVVECSFPELYALDYEGEYFRKYHGVYVIDSKGTIRGRGVSGMIMVCPD